MHINMKYISKDTDKNHEYREIIIYIYIVLLALIVHIYE